VPSFYQRVEGSVAIEEALGTIARTAAILHATGNHARGERYDEILVKLIEDLDLASRRSAAKADAFIRSRLRNTEVGRPSPVTGTLASHIHSIAGRRGAFGIAEIESLDLTINARSGGIYWRAQEWGYAGNVGRIVPGFFQPGDSKPSGAEFRNHPYFEQRSARKKKSKVPAMVIRRPIPARYYLRDGTIEAVAFNARLRIEAETRASAALRVV
jgi:hypothetical protein